jgi:glycosyltransferase involved in cell wall biosynthesis
VVRDRWLIVRVVHVTNSLSPGGVTTVLLELAMGQQARHSVTVGTLTSGGWDDRARKAGLRLLTGRALLKEMRTADVVHAHHRTPGLLSSVISPGATVDHVHNYFTNRARLSFRGNAVVAVSANLQDHLLAHYPHAAGRLQVIPNGVPPSAHRWRGPTASEGLRLLGVGRLVEQKDPLYFLAIIRELVGQGRSVSATWVGDGPLLADFERQRERDGLTDVINVERWRPRDELLDELSRVDALLMTSRWEGLPMIGLESLAAGVPIFSTPVGDLTEAIKQVQPELVLERGDASAASSRILQMLSDGAAVRRLSNGLFDLWEATYDFRRLLDEWDRVYVRAQGSAGRR